ncbi:MAG: hypothetical protein QOK17_113 [Sphingomonadales bacterium]|jgi:hypothetical protein|nr:hypothetical protein [Sphingomonadales bacterium]
MKLPGLAAAAAIFVSSLGLAAAADAQPPVRERTVVRTTVEPRPMRERTVMRTTVVRRHAGWNRGHHYGWRNHQRICRTVWRHHRRIHTCRVW